MQMAKVYVAKKRKLSVGDKWRVLTVTRVWSRKIVPVRDMPFLRTVRRWTSCSIASVCQPYEYRSSCMRRSRIRRSPAWSEMRDPIFDGAHWNDVKGYMAEANLDTEARTELYDGRSGR